MKKLHSFSGGIRQEGYIALEVTQKKLACTHAQVNKKTEDEGTSNKPLTGFTLIEILVVIGMIAILATIVIIAINPSRQFAQGRNSQRVSNVNALLNAIGQNISDNKGIFVCAAGGLPTSTTPTKMASTGGYDIASCITPTYLSVMVYDPSVLGASYVSTSSYDTEYNIKQDATTGRITVNAPGAELGQTIAVTR